jgi:hypothetical protein
MEDPCQVQKVLDEIDMNRLLSQRALAMVYIGDGQVQKVVELLEHVIALRESALVQEHSDQLA